MVDFVTSLRAGISAAEAADRARKEILEVFEELNRQLASAFDGHVQIKLADRPQEKVAQAVKLLADREWGNQFLLATNPNGEDGNGVELAFWSTSRDGYPCRIRLAGSEYFCEDRQGLEETLQTVLARADIGAKINSLLKEDVAVA